MPVSGEALVSCDVCDAKKTFPALSFHRTVLGTGWMIWWRSGNALCPEHSKGVVY